MKAGSDRSPQEAKGVSAGAADGRRRRSILVVDDHPMMRAGLVQLIDRQPDLIVAAEAGDPAEAAKRLSRGMVDLVLTDLTLPGKGGLEFIKDLHVLYPALPVLVLSMHDEAFYAERVLRAGARGYIMKETGGEMLLGAIRQVLVGNIYVSTAMTSSLLAGIGGSTTRGSRSPFSRLTDREMEVFQLIGLGNSTREIAGKLNLSTKTVDAHRSNIRTKLGLVDSTALIRHAIRWMESQ